MAGAAKKRAQAEKQSNCSSNGSSSESRDPTQRSAPKSIPRLDGNRDPNLKIAVDYAVPTDLKNISDFLGLAGWYTARGVSKNALLYWPPWASCTHASLNANNSPPSTSPTIQAPFDSHPATIGMAAQL
jgi:eukaryotic translation initiation factor 2C